MLRIPIFFMACLYGAGQAMTALLVTLSAYRLLLPMADVRPLRLTQFDLAAVIILSVIAPVMIRPKDLTVFLAGLLLVPFYWAVARGWDFAGVGSATEFIRLMNGEVRTTAEWAALIATLGSVLYVACTMTWELGRRWSLKVWILVWRRTNPLVAAVLRRDYALLSEAHWGAPAYLQRESTYRRSPLHWAAEAGDLEATRILLNRNASALSSTDEVNDTPLHLATRFGHRAVAKIMLEAGAPLIKANRRGTTPLDLVLRRRNLEEVRDVLATRPELREMLRERVATIHWPEAARLLSSPE